MVRVQTMTLEQLQKPNVTSTLVSKFSLAPAAAAAAAAAGTACTDRVACDRVPPPRSTRNPAPPARHCCSARLEPVALALTRADEVLAD